LVEHGAPEAMAFNRTISNDLLHAKCYDAFTKDLGSVAEIAWTSTRSNSQGREFCAILNECCRYTNQNKLHPKTQACAKYAALFARSLNGRLVSERGGSIKYPFKNGGLCYRGGGLPNHLRAFFAEGTIYRAPNYLATSCQCNKAYEFMSRAHQAGLPAVMWHIQIDPRGDPNGQNDVRYQVRNVNWIKRTAPGCPNEDEFLFTAYSAFKVTKVEWSAHPNCANPHKIWLYAIDNRNAPCDLPLSPWS